MLKHLYASLNTKLTFNVSSDWIPPFQWENFQLHSCNITNGFPQWLRNQRKLWMLVLSNARMSGPLPGWLRKMPIIPHLDLSHNQLSGPLKNLPNVATYGRYRFGPSLFLENNFFSESIPSSLCRRRDLVYLDLSKNRLTGKIPTCFVDLQQLYTLILSSNWLSGVVPSSVALNSLHQLKLNDNNFVGELPRELANLLYLSILDLGDNRLSGNIPEWVAENLANLVVLRLHKNNFTGRIPQSLRKASHLRILDVADNNLKGTIPPCLGELDAMGNDHDYGYFPGSFLDDDENVEQVMKGVSLEYTTTWDLVYNMDLSSNKTALIKLVGLNLSNNHLSRYIPDSIGNMTELESLDLSGNELNGMIPPSMANLTFLSRLKLSHNNLYGRIPTGRQLQTLTDPSIYEGNKDLCGPPLPNNCSKPGEVPTRSKKKQGASDEKTEVWLFYVDIICGFATGFWGVIGLLLFKKQWRWIPFMFAEETMDKIYVAIVVRVNKITRGREAVQVLWNQS
ncbi:unnamed protein product [Lactuca saligna]|nr:unnamed protein product [Lactuca saligna]